MIGRRALVAGLACTPIAVAARPTAPDIAAQERARLRGQAARWRKLAPRTIAAIPAPRSPGGRQDYYSEADYWWADPANPGGPYMRRDGYSNPDKFDGHRDALIAVGRAVPALTAAWLATGDWRAARAAVAHLHAWFVDPATRMNPNLAHAQAIIGRDTGRAIGIIDTLQIAELARAAKLLRDRGAPGLDAATAVAITAWFRAYLDWLTGSTAGREERDQLNNHGTCWLLQAAAFADLTGDARLSAALRIRLIDVIVAGQIAADGRQPRELARTKPYGYSLFNLDVLATAAQLLATPDRPLWRERSGSSGSITDAVAFMAPFIADRARWPFARDVEHFDDWPVRHPSLLFAGLALGRSDWIALWRRLDPDPAAAEIIRNYPIRQPLLWL